MLEDAGVAKIFNLVDIDQSGWISFTEFRGWFETIFSEKLGTLHSTSPRYMKSASFSSTDSVERKASK